MSGAIRKSELLRRIGFAGDPGLAEECLRRHGLSHPRKVSIAVAKVDAVRDAFSECFMMVCNRGDCQAAAKDRQDGRPVVLTHSQATCEVCGGSVIQTAIWRLAGTLAANGMRRLCVVGGSPKSRRELRDAAAATTLETRLIDGMVARSRKDAGDDEEWADVVVIWAPTQLKHKASQAYVGRNVVRVTQRGLPALVESVTQWVVASRSARPPGRA